VTNNKDTGTDYLGVLQNTVIEKVVAYLIEKNVVQVYEFLK
jgi:hypothetical protein